MFSTPLWLAALVTLAIPIALHLWSRRPRRLIQVGSLRHLNQLPRPHARTASLSQPLLLLLRLAALTTIVVALAGPRLRGRPLGLQPQLTLVEPALLADPVLDSLRQARATVRLLAPGLPEITLSATGSAAPHAATPLWQALAEADRLVASGGTIDLFARPRLVALGEQRPAIRATVRWHRTPRTPGRAYAVSFVLLEHDSLQAIYAAGDPAAVDYHRVRSGAGSRPSVPRTSPSDAAVRRLRVRLVPVDSPLARRVAIAVRAVAVELGQRVAVAEVSDPQDGEILLSRETAQGPGLADSIFAHWPWAPFTPDTADPRWVSLSQATPARVAAAEDADRPPGTLAPLLLAAVLLLLERGLATRPAASGT